MTKDEFKYTGIAFKYEQYTRVAKITLCAAVIYIIAGILSYLLLTEGIMSSVYAGVCIAMSGKVELNTAGNYKLLVTRFCMSYAKPIKLKWADRLEAEQYIDN